MPRPLTPIHLAIPVHDLAAARAFYGGVLGCAEGRSAERWIDFDLFGHQLVCHRVDGARAPLAGDNPVDGHDVPVPHFGVVLELPEWEALATRLRAAGKPAKVAIVACIRKLLTILNVMLRTNTPWRENVAEQA